MPVRRLGREWALKLLYHLDVHGIRLDQADLRTFWERFSESDEPLSEREWRKIRRFAEELVRGVAAQREALDKVIRGAATNWELARMAVVDRNLLRLGAHELLERPDIDAAVTINEAVEIAKVYGERDTGAFVNAILDKIRRLAEEGGAELEEGDET